MNFMMMMMMMIPMNLLWRCSNFTDRCTEYGTKAEDKKSVLLTVVWGVGISAFIVNFGYTLVTGRVCDGNAEMQFCKVFFK